MKGGLLPVAGTHFSYILAISVSHVEHVLIVGIFQLGVAFFLSETLCS
jgi:hypothetical protein